MGAAWRDDKGRAVRRLPAVPPSDYRGTQAAWMIGLQERGWWNGKGFHGDVILTTAQYDELLTACEGDDAP